MSVAGVYVCMSVRLDGPVRACRCISVCVCPAVFMSACLSVCMSVCMSDFALCMYVWCMCVRTIDGVSSGTKFDRMCVC